jgi:hypothetical protein
MTAERKIPGIHRGGQECGITAGRKELGIYSVQ